MDEVRGTIIYSLTATPAKVTSFQDVDVMRLGSGAYCAAVKATISGGDRQKRVAFPVLTQEVMSIGHIKELRAEMHAKVDELLDGLTNQLMAEDQAAEAAP